MTKSPGHLITIALIIAVLARLGAKYLGQFSGYAGFLGYTHLHKAVLPVLGFDLRRYTNAASRKTPFDACCFLLYFRSTKQQHELDQAFRFRKYSPFVHHQDRQMVHVDHAHSDVVLQGHGLHHRTGLPPESHLFHSHRVVEIPSGYLADILGRKTTLLAGGIFGTLGFVIYATTGTYLWFILAEVTLGIGQSLISGADSAMLYDTLQAQKRQNQYTRYEGINTSVGNFAEALGAILGGALAEVSLRLPFIGQSFIAFMAIPAALTLVEPERLQRQVKSGFRDILKIVHYALVVNKDLRWGLVYSSLIGTATLTMAWVYQLELHAFGFSEFYIGATATGLNLVVGLVTLTAWKAERDLRPRLLIPLITLVITGGFVAGGLAGSWLPFMLVLLVFYMARGIATPVL